MKKKKEIKRKSIISRLSKVSVADIGTIPSAQMTVAEMINNLPNILAAKDLRDLISELVNAKSKSKEIVVGMGGHVVKTGVTPYLIELMQQGFITSIALNGAALIHDFELSNYGHTSENVEKEIIKGEFGFSEETGKVLNEIINQGYEQGLGLGEIMVQAFQKNTTTNKNISLVSEAGRLGIPVTVHVAIGTDIIHMHPECDGAALGQGTLIDFKRFCECIANIDGGGGYLNLGSAVILPEVFLKAVSVARNINSDFGDFFCANFDFIKHYRPTQSVIERPLLLGARTYSLIGHHEIMIPLLAMTLLEMDLKK